jgi:hypothetical protein
MRALALSLASILFVQLSFSADRSFLGFDRNEYPGDGPLKELHKTFAFAGYWLNNPPGAASNTWIGTRAKVEAAGFGFLVLFNGRLDKELGAHAAELGRSDGSAAVSAARREGFPARTIIFLDQEEGGRLLPEQRAYLLAWVDEVARGGFRAGVYCSGIAFREGGGANIVTAQDIRANADGRAIAFWVTNDACPPSPGCVTDTRLTPHDSGIDFAEVWQFAQSPRRKSVAGGCPGYDQSGACYAPDLPRQKIDIDLDVAVSPDPSHGRRTVR